jgi:hypothetical protein
MSDGRLQRVLDLFAVKRADPWRSLGDALCATGVDVLELPGAGITLQGPNGDPQSIGTSTADMATLHDLERTLGEGPCVDAFARGEPMSEPDLVSPATVRWPAFSAGALRTEARAAFGYPLKIGGARIGALNLYAARPGELSGEQHRDALLLADVATHAVLSASTSGELTRELLDIGLHQLEVHQATGMISVQLSVPVADALARLRAHAYAEDRSISSVANDVVNRRVRFEP